MMSGEELVLAVLLIMAVVAQFVRVWKQRGFEPKEEEADRVVNILLQESKRIPVREPGGLTQQPGLARPATEAFSARRPPTFRIDANARTMRHGIILMTILGPCRGVNPFEFHG
ncbi:MAG: hypothetical protein OEV71_10630 [Nitrospira sp.]|nr:hypothetical protein [Nitrospira sp.]MDH4343543.1 hypothetical protein [Nitrospira sp.]MDH5337869.1 hypothetical protein [Nitrospira sp.]